MRSTRCWPPRRVSAVNSGPPISAAPRRRSPRAATPTRITATSLGRDRRHVVPPALGGAAGPRGRAWVSHEAAARLHGLDRARPDVVEFTVPRSSRKLTCSARVHTTRHVGTARRDHRRWNAVFIGDEDDHRPCPSQNSAHSPRRPPSTARCASDCRRRSPRATARELRGPGRWGARTLDQLLSTVVATRCSSGDSWH